MSERTIIVVGVGVIGISTVLAAKQRHPEYIIYLINVAPLSVKPASEDTGRIIHDVYNDKAYAALAAKAMELWQAELVYRE
jgi:glycine/D-amino acid oxidase-like deaminating enzyme